MFSLILVSAIAVFTVSEAANVAKRNEGCSELTMCIEHIGSLLESIVASNLAIFTNVGRLEKLCENNTDFQSCFASKKDNCDDSAVISFINNQKQEIDYLCSDEGRAGLQESSDSPCITNQTTLLGVQQSMDVCVENFQLEDGMAANDQGADPVDKCQIVDNLTRCILLSLTDCGNDFSTVAEKMWEINLKQTAEEIGCSHLETRNLPLVLA